MADLNRSGTIVPEDAPPSYDQARNDGASRRNRDSLTVPGQDAGQGVGESSSASLSRRSMEDRARPLPDGWIRQLDPESAHHFYVDTKAKPPRSIWTHPYDDQEYMSSLSEGERQRIQHERTVQEDTASDDDDEAPRPSRANVAGDGQPKRTFGRKMKDKLTGTTHEQREQQRRAHAEAERRAYQNHQHIQQCLLQAARTGQPVLVGRDSTGREVWANPRPRDPYGYGPYSRPVGPYGRGPYRGGMGMGGAGIGMGLLGGMLLGGALF